MAKGVVFYVFLLLTIYVFLYPKHYMIADEVYYAQQGIMLFQDNTAFNIQEWSDGKPSLHNIDIRNYKIGTGLAIGALMLLLGNEAQYLIGIISLLITLIAVALSLKKIGYSPLWASLLVLSPANGLLCRTIMSDLPSMALSGIFIFLLIRNKRTAAENIAAASILGISYFFRETNIILIGLLSLPFVFGKNNYKLLYVATAAIATSMLIFVTVNIFQEPLFSRDLGGLNFLPSNLLYNLPMYSLIMMTMIPLGIVFICSYKGIHARLFQCSTIALILTYLLYGYNGFEASGAKGVFLNARFMLPLFPIAIIATAYSIEKQAYFSNTLLKIISILGLISFLFFNILGYLHNEKQDIIVNSIIEDKDYIYTSNSSSYLLKYANYFTGGKKQVVFDKEQIKKCLENGEKIAVIYAQSMSDFKKWFDFSDGLKIEEKKSVTFMDDSSLRIIHITQE